MSAKGSTKLFLGLVLAVALDTAVQLILKSGVSAVPDAATIWQTAQAMLRQPVFLGVAALMACQYVNWMNVLHHADLSYAHAITSLSYVSVAMLSVLFLGETLDPVQLLGIILILTGVWFVGRSGRIGSLVKANVS
jgi:drug/metabolite transporter (DMT)-like permease